MATLFFWSARYSINWLLDNSFHVGLSWSRQFGYSLEIVNLYHSCCQMCYRVLISTTFNLMTVFWYYQNISMTTLCLLKLRWSSRGVIDRMRLTSQAIVCVSFQTKPLDKFDVTRSTVDWIWVFSLLFLFLPSLAKYHGLLFHGSGKQLTIEHTINISLQLIVP